MNRETSEQGAGVEMMALRQETAEAIDAVATGPVLVGLRAPLWSKTSTWWPLPRTTRPSQLAPRRGFIRWGHTWARFGLPGRTVSTVVDRALADVGADASSLFQDAEPIPGFATW